MVPDRRHRGQPLCHSSRCVRALCLALPVALSSAVACAWAEAASQGQPSPELLSPVRPSVLGVLGTLHLVLPIPLATWPPARDVRHLVAVALSLGRLRPHAQLNLWA